MSFQLLPILTVISLILALIGIFFGFWGILKTKEINRRMAILFSGKEAKDLETIILTHAEEIKALDKEIQELFEISNKINSLAFKGVHKVGVVRFNPFKDIGGDQSFALALLNGSDNGLVVSSLHTREGTRVYAKPILKGSSPKYTLTEEEKRAILQATSLTSQSPKNQ